MQALRLARPRAPLRRSLVVRSLATTANPTHAHVASAPSATTTKSHQSIIPLSNVEAQWEKLSQEDKITVHSQLEALQKKDWKTLSIDEKKAGEFFFRSFLFAFIRYRSCTYDICSHISMCGRYAVNSLLRGIWSSRT
jgi:hypothetical protein